MIDERRARTTLIWMCVLAGVNQLGFGSVVPALPLYAQSFGVSVSAIGLAVGVIGGMGSILGSILTGVLLGLLEGLTKVFYPEASSIVVFVIMVIVLMVRPAGLFGKEK